MVGPVVCFFHEVKHRDLILPRKAWLKCNGLPLSLWNQANWVLIAKEWGSFSHVEPLVSKDDMLSSPLICVNMGKVIKIKKTFKSLP